MKWSLVMFLHENKELFEEVIFNTADFCKLPIAIIEKDYYVKAPSKDFHSFKDALWSLIEFLQSVVYFNFLQNTCNNICSFNYFFTQNYFTTSNIKKENIRIIKFQYFADNLDVKICIFP